MAFPQVSDADTQSNHVTSNSNSWTLTYPTNIASGDLLLGFVATDGSTTPTWPAGWVNISGTSGNAVTLHLAKKKATGSETGTFTLGLSGSEQGSWQIIRITAASWHGTLGTSFVNSSPDDGDVCRVQAVSASANPDPYALDPYNWDAEDTLWIVALAVDTSRTVSVFPANYTNTYSDPSGGSTGATLATCRRELNTSSEDPSSFTISNSDDFTAVTVGVRPAAGGAQTVTGSFSANAVLKKTQSPTGFAVVAVKLTTTAVAFGIAATLKKTIQPNFPVAAAIYKSGFGFFTADVVLKKTISPPAGLPVAAQLVHRVEGSFPVAANAKGTVASSFGIAAVLKKTQYGSYVDRVAGASVLYWPFDEPAQYAPFTSRDASGHGNVGDNPSTGTPIHAGEAGAPIPGGTSYWYPGNSFDHTQIVSPTGIPVGNASRSIDFWVKTYFQNHGDTYFMFGDGGSNRLLAYGGSWNDDLRIDDGSGGVLAFDQRYLNTLISDTSWHYVAITYDGSTRLLDVYVDGAWKGSATASGNLATSLGTTGVLTSPGPDGTLNGLTGWMAHFSISDHVLTPDEILIRSLGGTNLLPLSAYIAHHFEIGAWIAGVAVTGQFSVSAILRKTQSSSFSVSAILRKTQSGSFALAANKAGIFGVAALIRGTVGNSFPVEYMWLSGGAGLFGLAATIRKTMAGSMAVAAVLRQTLGGTMSVAATLKATISPTGFPLDALKRGTVSSTLPAAAVIRKTASSGTTVAATLRKTLGNSFPVEYEWAGLTAFAVAATIIVRHKKLFQLSAYLAWRYAAIDALIKGSSTSSFAVAAWKIPAGATTKYGSGLLDALFLGPVPSSLTLDAVIVSRTKTAGFAVNADTKGVNEKRATMTLAAVLGQGVSRLFAIDGLIGGNGYFRLAAWLQPTFAINAYIVRVSGGGSFSLAALLRTTQAWGFALNAMKASVGETRSSTNIDAAIKGPRASSFPVDAVVTAVPFSGTVTDSTHIDAYIRGNNIVIYPEDGGPPILPDGSSLPPGYAAERAYRIKITVAGTEITGDVIWSRTSFTQNAKTSPGTFELVLDGAFTFNGGEEIVLEIDDARTFGGYILQVEYGYAFADSSTPLTTLRGVDYNVLFDRTFVYNKLYIDAYWTAHQSRGGEYVNWLAFAKGTLDTTIIAKVFSSYIDQADVDYTSHVTSVGSVATEVPWVLPTAGMNLRATMQSISQVTNAVWWIDANKCLWYTDRTTVTAPYPITDGVGGITAREVSISSDMSQLVTEDWLWGTLAQTVDGDVIVSHHEQTESLPVYGHWQYGEERTEIHHASWLSKRAGSVISRYGQPINRASCVIYDPGYMAGMVANVKFDAHGIDENLVIRQVVIDFAVGKEPVGDTYYGLPRYRLSMGLEPESPWTIYDYLPYPNEDAKQGGTGNTAAGRSNVPYRRFWASMAMPWTLVFDSFTRTLASGWGTGDAGQTWTTGYSSYRGASSVDGSNGLLTPNAALGVDYNTTLLYAPLPVYAAYTMVARFKTPVTFSPSSAQMGFHFARSDSVPRASAWLSFNGMQLELDLPISPVGNQSFSWVTSTWYMIKFYYDSTGAAKLKVWADGSSEPGWMAEGTTTDPGQADWLGVHFYNSSATTSKTVAVDYIDFEGEEEGGPVIDGWNTETIAVADGKFSTQAKVVPYSEAVYDQDGYWLAPYTDWDYADQTGKNFVVLKSGVTSVTITYLTLAPHLQARYSTPRITRPNAGGPGARGV